MTVIVDSGASSTVMHPNIGRQYDVQESTASKAGVCYEIANGLQLPNLGEKSFAVMTEEGFHSGIHGTSSRCLKEPDERESYVQEQPRSRLRRRR